VKGLRNTVNLTTGEQEFRDLTRCRTSGHVFASVVWEVSEEGVHEKPERARGPSDTSRCSEERPAASHLSSDTPDNIIAICCLVIWSAGSGVSFHLQYPYLNCFPTHCSHRWSFGDTTEREEWWNPGAGNL